jgi:hypothetical protein
MRIRFRVAATVALCLAAGSALAGELSVKMSVSEPAGVARRAEPFCGGIPLPRRTYKRDQEFSVRRNGQQVPAQVLPMVVDEKGYVWWVLVDLQSDVPAKGRVDFVLTAARSSAKPSNPLKVTEGGDGVTVDTGRVKFTMSKNEPFGLFSAVEAGGEPLVAGGEVTYTDAWGEKPTYKADKPYELVVEYRGPMRTTVCAKGFFVGDEKTKLRYIARVTAWAGKSRVHVKFKLSNSNEKHYCYRQIKEYSIALKLAGKPGGSLVGAGKPTSASADAVLISGLRTRAAGAAKIIDGDKETWASMGKGDVAQGWIAARTGTRTVYACDTYFSDDPPRKLAVKDGQLILTGTAARFDGGKRELPFAAKHRVLFDCSHLSSQYIIDFAAPSDGKQLDDLAKGARGWLHLMAEPSWYFETDSLGVGTIGTQADEMKAYDNWKWTYNKSRAPTRPGKIGTRRYVLYEDNHFESEQDSVEGYLLMYLRTGYRTFFEGCQGWANYEMDRQKWRTDGWKWKDGGVWKRSGPLGNRPQRGKDPVSGSREYCPGRKCKHYEPGAAGDMYKMSIGSQCRCHNYGSGMAGWYCITGDRDALEAAVDSVEQMIDYQRRVKKLVPGNAVSFSRDFTRSVYLTNATRLAAPTDETVIDASDHLSKVYLDRKIKEPRGLVTGAHPLRTSGFYKYSKSGTPKEFVGPKGMAAMAELGITYDKSNGQLTDPKTGVKWFPIPKPNSFMLPSIAGGIHSYYRATGDDDAHDWVVAFGQGLSYVLWQSHGQQHPMLLVDFPKKGIVRDLASWSLGLENKDGSGFKISGYLARFYPDVPARAYELCGEPFLKQRSYDYWNSGSHRGYWAPRNKGLGKVTSWATITGPHAETVCFTGHTFYIHSRTRQDAKPPHPVKDLKVLLAGDKATVSFTAPADAGGGKVVRYQVKCSDKPIVGYRQYLKLYNDARDQEKAECNWWMAANLAGEPKPKAPGAKESFTVTGVPAGAKYFAVRSFDDSCNRSEVSSVAE